MIKKVLLGIVAVVGIVVGILFIGGLFLDREIVLNTEQRVRTPPAQLLPLLSSSAGIEKWSAVWLKDTGGAPAGLVVKKKGGPDEGVGLVVTFEGPDGKVYETWTIREVHPPNAQGALRVVYDVDFAGIMTTRRTLTLTPGSFEGCDAHWGEVADIANPMYRWMMKRLNFDEVIENRNKALRALDTAATGG